MKKNLIYGLMSAIALTGAIGFTACSSDDAATDVNPTYDGNSVKTQFSISFPDNVVSTRMSSSTVQEAQTVALFRGMEGIVLIPYYNKTDRTSRLGANITLGKLVKPATAEVTNAIPAGNLLEESKAVLFNDVTIPVGTSAFLFYGKATGTDGFANGSLTPAGLDGESEGISFTPTPIISGTPNTAKGVAHAAYVSSIAAAANGDAAWYKCADENYNTTANQAWYNSALGDLYTKFISMKAGASSYVQAVVQDLYSSIRNNTDVVSVAIKNAILNSDYASDASSSGTLTFTEAISGYPGNINMPEGAAALTWSSASPSVASVAANANVGNNTMLVVNMADITFPASLYYFVDSNIKTSNTVRISDYTAVATWDDILSAYNGEEVAVATRSVAMNKPIQYAVGRLDVKVNQLSAAKYYDRKGEEVTIPEGGFQLTGVLIGGQKPVDYKFNQKTGTGIKEYTIYDNTINTEGTHKNLVKADQDAGINYTLALETAANQSVYVALEFLNTSGTDFRGIDGIVKKNCKFYMVAKLDPSEGADYSSGTKDKVFMQDYKTIANFTIGAGSSDPSDPSTPPGGFANAYTTIPDLRTPELELGFSVNLEWQSGLSFNVEF